MRTWAYSGSSRGQNTCDDPTRAFSPTPSKGDHNASVLLAASTNGQETRKTFSTLSSGPGRLASRDDPAQAFHLLRHLAKVAVQKLSNPFSFMHKEMSLRFIISLMTLPCELERLHLTCRLWLLVSVAPVLSSRHVKQFLQVRIRLVTEGSKYGLCESRETTKCMWAGLRVHHDLSEPAQHKERERSQK